MKIRTFYADLIIDKDYSDYYSETYYGYFSDYVSIFRTAEIINLEISDAVASFSLQDQAGRIKINWISSVSAEANYGKEVINFYKPDLHEVTVTTISGYLHEYYHHLEHLLNPDLGQCWQSQAFCEMGRARSNYSLFMMENTFSQSEEWSDLFHKCTGRTYQSGIEDYYEAYDILCYITDEFTLDYYYGRNGINSFCHYLTDLYGEKTVYSLMLYPDTVFSVTEKNWDELESGWKASVLTKYEGVEIPEWIKNSE